MSNPAATIASTASSIRSASPASRAISPARREHELLGPVGLVLPAVLQQFAGQGSLGRLILDLARLVDLVDLAHQPLLLIRRRQGELLGRGLRPMGSVFSAGESFEVGSASSSSWGWGLDWAAASAADFGIPEVEYCNVPIFLGPCGGQAARACRDGRFVLERLRQRRCGVFRRCGRRCRARCLR